MGNPFVHVELTTTDHQKAKAFYGKLFDWTLEDADMGNSATYTMIKVGEGTGGGIFEMKNAPPMWLAYVGVADVRAATDKATALGARLVREVTEVPGFGWFSIITDPQGAMLALWQPKPRA